MNRALTAIGLLLASPLMVTPPTLAAAAVEETLSQKTFYFDIPATGLDKALTTWSRTVGVRFLKLKKWNNKKSPRLQGQYTAPAALQLLLEGSGLSYEFVNNRSMILRPWRAARTFVVFMPSQSDVRPIDEVVVTGTRIEDATPGGYPVITIDMAKLREEGPQTFQEMFDELPQMFGGATPDTSFPFSPNPSPGVTNSTWPTIAELRGLGPGTTLVLLNGRRVALSAADAGMYSDLRTIPFSAIDRIEVLTDGASAIYGSDAIGGVVNLIIPDIAPGARTQLHIDQPSSRGGTFTSISQNLGASWSRGLAGFVYEYQKSESVSALERPATRDIANNGYDWARLSPGERNHLFFGNARQYFAGASSAFLELSLSRRNVEGGYGLDGPPATDIDKNATSKQISVVTGVEWVGDRFNVHLDTGFSKSNVRNELVLFAPAFAASPPFESRMQYKTRFVGANIDGTAFSLPTGDVKLASGLGFRRESYSSSDLQGAAIATDISDVFTEIRIPLLSKPSEELGHSSLILSIAGRYERYSFFGGSTVPKIGIEWYPSTSLRFRSSYGSSFKAPALVQLAGAGGSEVLENVALAGSSPRILARFGPNGDLKPERAHTFTAGLDWAPSFANLTAKVTYFNIDYEDRIESIHESYANVLQNMELASAATERGDLPDVDFNNLVSRILLNSTNRVIGCNVPTYLTGPCAENPGDVDAVLDLRLQNIAETRTDGLDVFLKGEQDAGAGTLNFSFNATQIFNFKTRATSESLAEERANTIYYPLSLRLRTGVGYRYGGLSLNAFLNYSNDYRNVATPSDEGIGSMTTVDLSLVYKRENGVEGEWSRGFSAAVRARNLFNTSPPRVPASNGVRYDPRNEDALGRAVSLTLAFNW